MSDTMKKKTRMLLAKYSIEIPFNDKGIMDYELDNLSDEIVELFLKEIMDIRKEVINERETGEDIKEAR